jgi:hypothetical protein
MLILCSLKIVYIKVLKDLIQFLLREKWNVTGNISKLRCKHWHNLVMYRGGDRKDGPGNFGLG